LKHQVVGKSTRIRNVTWQKNTQSDEHLNNKFYAILPALNDQTSGKYDRETWFKFLTRSG
jgi:hypothetical protein